MASSPAGRHGRFLSVGIGNCEWIPNHAAAPGKADPSQGAGSNDLEDDVVGLGCGNVCGLRYAIDDVAGESGCGFSFGEGEAGFGVFVARRAW